MKFRPVAELVLTVFALCALPALADVGRGSALYENHCGECHSARLHDREQRVPTNLAELRWQVDRWQKELKLQWSDEDIDDVVAFLNATKYKF